MSAVTGTRTALAMFATVAASKWVGLYRRLGSRATMRLQRWLLLLPLLQRSRSVAPYQRPMRLSRPVARHLHVVVGRPPLKFSSRLSL
jgi:hypothetical protein